MDRKDLIICDTNIWYGIASNSILKEEYENKKLVLTGHAIDEIISSENVYKNPSLVKKVVKAIRLNMTKLIHEDPFEFVYKLIPFKEDIDLSYRIKRYQYMLTLETEEIEPNISYEEFEEQIKSFAMQSSLSGLSH